MKRRLASPAANMVTAKRFRTQTAGAGVPSYDAVSALAVPLDLLVNEILPLVFREQPWTIRAWASTCKYLSIKVYEAIRHPLTLQASSIGRGSVESEYVRALSSARSITVSSMRCSVVEGFDAIGLKTVLASPALHELSCQELPVSLLPSFQNLRRLEVSSFSTPLKTSKALHALRNLDMLVITYREASPSRKVANDMSRFGGAMPRLRTLVVGSKTLPGLIADDWVAALDALPNLTSLSAHTLPRNESILAQLEHLELKHVMRPALSALTSLRTLTLSSAGAIPAACFATLPHLSRLCLLHCDLTLPDALYGATALRDLCVRSTTFFPECMFGMDARTAATLTQLECMSLKGLAVQCDALCHLLTLRELTLDSVNPRISLNSASRMVWDANSAIPLERFVGPVRLGTLTRLESLVLRKTHVRTSDFSCLRALRSFLYVRPTEDEQQWVGLAALPSLTHCVICSSHAETSSIWFDLASPSVSSLTLSRVLPNYAPGSDNLRNMPQLRDLNILYFYSANSVADELSALNIPLATLATLKLDHGSIYLTPLVSAQLTSLIGLSLVGNKLACISDAAAISSLQWLDARTLGKNESPEARAAAVRQLRNLRRLYVSSYDAQLCAALDTLPAFELLAFDELGGPSVVRGAYAIIHSARAPPCSGEDKCAYER